MPLRNAGIKAMGAYLPARALEAETKVRLLKFLGRRTLLPEAYLQEIENNNRLPGRIESNYDGWQKQAWFDAWLANLPESKRSNPFQGSEERRRVPFDPASLKESIIPHPMLPSDAETLAGAMALMNAGLKNSEIDLLLVASQVPDLPLPPNASLVQHKLQLENAGAYEIDTCCSSFLSMLELAVALVKSGIKRKILLVASYIDSFVSDKSDYFSVNTGDAAVAAVVEELDSGYGYLASDSTSHGSRHNGIILQRRAPQLCKAPVQRSRYEQEFVTFYNPQANKEIAVNSQKDMKEVVDLTLERAGLKVADLDFFVSHQPVYWAGNAWREALGIPEHKFYESFKKYGNIANCSAAANLYETIELGLVKENDLVLIASSGAGENHIAAIERISPELARSIRCFAGFELESASRPC